MPHSICVMWLSVCVRERWYVGLGSMDLGSVDLGSVGLGSVGLRSVGLGSVV